MEIKTRFPDQKIIAMSGSDKKKEFLETAVQFGASYFIGKPFTADDLLAAVAKVIPVSERQPDVKSRLIFTAQSHAFFFISFSDSFIGVGIGIDCIIFGKQTRKLRTYRQEWKAIPIATPDK